MTTPSPSPTRRPLHRFVSSAAVVAVSAAALVAGTAPAQATISLPNGAIKAYYDKSGGPHGTFGNLQTSEIKDTKVRNMVYAKTLNPSSRQWYWLTWSPSTSVRAVQTTGAIGSYWENHRAGLGAPVEWENCNAVLLCQQSFTNADVDWSKNTGTHVVANAFRAYYNQNGGMIGDLGAPIDEDHSVDGRSTQTFENLRTGSRTVLTWTADDGVSAYRLSGAVGELYKELGSTTGEMGVPTSNEFTGLTRGGAWQAFTRGRIYWSPSTQVQKVLYGPILNTWASQGSENGAWGYPTSGSWKTSFGWQQNFEGGVARQHGNGQVFFTPRTTEGSTIEQRLDASAAAAGLGPGQSATFGSAQATTGKMYANGVVLWSQKHGAVALSPHVYSVWKQNAAYPQSPGFASLPVSSSVRDGRLTTAFENMELAWFPERDLVLRTDRVLGAKDALVIGDSQLYDADHDQSWVSTAIRNNGFATSAYYARGGNGMVVDGTGTSGQYGSYYAGVVANRWALPSGDPGLVYIHSSGNDSYKQGDQDLVQSNTHATVLKLQTAYPKAKIIVAGVVSRNGATDRDEVSRHAEDGLMGTRAVFVPLKGVVTQWKAEGYLQDSVHFRSQDGHNYMAEQYTPYLRKFLK